MSAPVAARYVEVGDRVRGDGQVLVIAVSKPDDLNEGGWYLEAHEPTPRTNGWPWACHYLPDTLPVEVLR